MNKLILAVTAATATVFAQAETWFVDATSGNDSWDATTAEIPTSGTVGPKKTLSAVMALASVGDVIKAAEGTYAEGYDVVDGNITTNRVAVKAGVLLEATGRRKATIIQGDTTLKYRCIYFIEPTEDEKTAGIEAGVVKGFSITDGRTLGSKDTSVAYAQGGGALNAGLLVECDLYKNGAGYRGGQCAMKTTLLRCRVSNPDSKNYGQYDIYDNCKVVDTLVINGYRGTRANSFWNCTFRDVGSGAATFNNCLFLADTSKGVGSGSSLFKNCISAVDVPESGTWSTNEYCQFNVDIEDLKLAMPVIRPRAGSIAIDAGDATLYEAAFSSWGTAWSVHKAGKDLAGRPRVANDRIDVGCFEYNGEGDNLWYVDAAQGDDVNDGQHSNKAFRTLSRAMAERALQPGDEIRVAEGDYCERAELPYEAENITHARVVCLPGVRLVATGARDKTFISGSGGAYDAPAVRCVQFSARNSLESDLGVGGAIVKGFILRNGRTVGSSTAEIARQGGAVCGSGVAGDGLLVDSVITGCGAKYRGANVSAGVTLLRCAVIGSDQGAYEMYKSCSAIDTLFKDNLICYGTVAAWNCTFEANYAYSLAGGTFNGYNCLYLDSRANKGTADSPAYNVALHRCYSRNSFNTSSGKMTIDDACVGELTDAQLPMESVSTYPRTGSEVIDNGNLASYRAATNGWTELWQEEWTEKDLLGRDRVIGSSIDIGCCEYDPDFSASLLLYANASQPDDSGDGKSPATAKRTLAAALAAHSEVDPLWTGFPYEVVVAPGVYSEGGMVDSTYYGTNRVVVPSGVCVRGAGADVTVIEGKKSENPIASGCGTDSIRCVCLKSGSVLRGFTLRNGYAPTDVSSTTSSKYSGGGAAGAGLLVDCVISNTASFYRGSLTHNTDALRTYFGSVAEGGLTTFPVWRYHNMMDSVFSGQAYHQDGANIVNCTFLDASPFASAGTEGSCYNCIMLSTSDIQYHKCYNCRLVAHLNTEKGSSDGGGNEFGLSVGDLRMRNDGTYRPLRSSRARNAGIESYRDQVTASWSDLWKSQLDGTDFAGGPRVVEILDIGAGEYSPSPYGLILMVR